MESIPPSYEAATARNPWQIIAPHIASAELCALNRVSRGLHQVFAPCLWGNPASHFGTDNDAVYVALIRFKRVLKRVRLEVRELTHTLHLPPAEAEIYDGPHAEWLRDVLERLPNLQSLIVSRLPFFDHPALLALRTYSLDRRSSLENQCPKFALRLLIATECKNTTSQGLAEALDHFPNLTYLDLSSTLAARDRSVLSKLRTLLLIQVVKLRNVHLRDEDVVILAEALGRRVRVLCLQKNHLSDHSIRTLLGSCFEPVIESSGANGRRPRASSNIDVEDWPSGIERPDSALLDEFRDESYDDRLLQRLTGHVVSRLPFEDLPASGITHLHIADNDITVEGVGALIWSKRLKVLDTGSVSQSNFVGRPIDVRIPGVEKLTPILERSAQGMTSLRIDYSIVTEIAPSKEDEPPLAVCELSAEDRPPELEAEVSQVHELDSEIPPLYELDSRESVPRYELAGDMTQLVVSPPGDKKTAPSETDKPEIRRGSIFAPEAVHEEDNEIEDDELPVLTATGLGSMAQAMNGVGLSTSTTTGRTGPGLRADNVNLSISVIEDQRKALRSRFADKPHRLAPGMLPKLRTITLTEVPCYDKTSKLVDSLIGFIKDCASEAELADLQARLQPYPSPKSGQSRIKHHRQTAQEIFALRRIILEMAPAEPLSATSLQSPTLPKASKFTNRTKSSTEDADSENFWSASENDFTFFDDDEECGLPSIETGTQLPISAVSEKMTVMPSDTSQFRSALPRMRRGGHKHAYVDVIQELAKFRKERKAAYEAALLRGVKHVDGYWHGEVKVVRGHGSGGETDYYGNYFEKGGVYR